MTITHNPTNTDTTYQQPKKRTQEAQPLTTTKSTINTTTITSPTVQILFKKLKNK